MRSFAICAAGMAALSLASGPKATTSEKTTFVPRPYNERRRAEKARHRADAARKAAKKARRRNRK